MTDIQVVENFFPTIILKEVISKVEHSEARWTYKVRNPTHSDYYEVYKAQKNDPNIVEDLSYFQYKFYGSNSTLQDERIAEIFKTYIQSQFKLNVREILRINCNITSPYHNFQDHQYMMPHIDANIPHRSLIFYLHDSDGDTVLFDRCYDGISENITDLKVVKRVKPKKNLCLTFNGLRYHSASPSKSILRRIINVNYL
ncbi:MAG: hypothetical protein EBU90_09835 [Proteobacteria bacterium]|nr:hypothetical protein [Pseudomonadota bacterium]NBP14552.1 hypothetical protein [bacterium]